MQLTSLQQQLIDAINALDPHQVKDVLSKGVDPNFLTTYGFPLTILMQHLDQEWCVSIEMAYEENSPWSEEQKAKALAVYLDIFEQLVAAGANVHVWDCMEFYGVLWDATASACLPLVKRLLALGVNPNTKDEEDLTILSSVSHYLFACDFDEIDWSKTYPEQKEVLHLLRQNNAKMSKEL